MCSRQSCYVRLSKPYFKQVNVINILPVWVCAHRVCVLEVLKQQNGFNFSVFSTNNFNEFILSVPLIQPNNLIPWSDFCPKLPFSVHHPTHFVTRHRTLILIIPSKSLINPSRKVIFYSCHHAPSTSPFPFLYIIL